MTSSLCVLGRLSEMQGAMLYVSSTGGLNSTRLKRVTVGFLKLSQLTTTQKMRKRYMQYTVLYSNTLIHLVKCYSILANGSRVNSKTTQ
jgi:hypothetical protein